MLLSTQQNIEKSNLELTNQPSLAKGAKRSIARTSNYIVIQLKNASICAIKRRDNLKRDNKVTFINPKVREEG